MTCSCVASSITRAVTRIITLKFIPQVGSACGASDTASSSERVSSTNGSSLLATHRGLSQSVVRSQGHPLGRCNNVMKTYTDIVLATRSAFLRPPPRHACDTITKFESRCSYVTYVTAAWLLQVAVVSWLAHPTVVWEDPGSNLTGGGCVYHDSHCDIQPWARVAHLYCSA